MIQRADAVGCRTLVLAIGLALGSAALADGVVIDKIYHPYVQPLEREVELRSSIENGGSSQTSDRQVWRLGYGMSLNDSWFGELYLIGQKDSMDSFRLSAYEVEALWQITEQGEYAADWGLLFEYEWDKGGGDSEFSTTLLVEKEWQDWSVTANLTGSYEWSNDIDNEFETALAIQSRYRWRPALEPALEFYSAEDTLGMGPVVIGRHTLHPGKQVYWEAGVIFGLQDETPDQTFRLLLEYEF